MDQRGITIILRALNSVKFNSDKTEVTTQVGAIVQEVVKAAYAGGGLVPAGNCNCIGALGTILGGGFSRLTGLYGLGVDNLLSMNVITAAGQSIEINSQSDPDLW